VLNILSYTSQLHHLLYTISAAIRPYKTFKVYLAGIHLEHLERSFEDPTKDELLHLLCTGIKRSQGAQTCTHLPITITVLQTLKSQLCLDSAFSLFQKRLLWAAFTMAFYGFLRASEFATSSLKWQHVQRTGNAYTIFIEQSKTDLFHCGHSITIHASGTSTCPVKALQLYSEAVPQHQGNAPIFKGGRFSPLNHQQLTHTTRHLLQSTSYNKQHYSSHSFRSGAATTAAAAGFPDWLIKALGRWNSNTYQLYIQSSPKMLESVPAQLACVNIPNGEEVTTEC